MSRLEVDFLDQYFERRKVGGKVGGNVGGNVGGKAGVKAGAWREPRGQEPGRKTGATSPKMGSKSTSHEPLVVQPHLRLTQRHEW